MSTAVISPRQMVATIVVAASNSLETWRASWSASLGRYLICDGVNDHIEIQAAIDALPGAGGEVRLLDGTYHVEVQINLDSNQTLRGCGANTVLTTSTASIIFLSAVGGSGTEKTGITISDLQIDGDSTGDCGIHFEYVNNFLIENVNSSNQCETGIGIFNSNSFIVTKNTCNDNGLLGINIQDSTDGNIVSNITNMNTIVGQDTQNVKRMIFKGNISNWNGTGFYLSDSSNCIISGNIIVGNGAYGIQLDDIGYESSNNIITNNLCLANSQSSDNSFDDIYLSSNSNYNNIQGNTCHAKYASTTLTNGEPIGETEIAVDDATGLDVGLWVVFDLGGANEEYHQIIATNLGASPITIDSGLTHIQALGATIAIPRPKYGINNRANTGNFITNNDLYNDGFGTAPFNDAGTGTRLASITVPFSNGTDPQDSGFLIDLAAEYARAHAFLDLEVVQVVRMKVYARSVVLEADKMRAEFVIYGGADNQPYNTHDGSVANHPSTSSNFAANDVIYWTIITAGVLALLGGDSIEVKVLYEDAGGADCATNAYFRAVTIEYV